MRGAARDFSLFFILISMQPLFTEKYIYIFTDLKIFGTFFKPRIMYAIRGYLNFNSRIIYAIKGYFNSKSRIIYAIMGYFSSKTMLIYAFWG